MNPAGTFTPAKLNPYPFLCKLADDRVWSIELAHEKAGLRLKVRAKDDLLAVASTKRSAPGCFKVLAIQALDDLAAQGYVAKRKKA
jgi:hypothetical protein